MTLMVLNSFPRKITQSSYSSQWQDLPGGIRLSKVEAVLRLDENGNVPNAGKALMADAIGTTIGACLGVSTVTTYVDAYQTYNILIFKIG